MNIFFSVQLSASSDSVAPSGLGCAGVTVLHFNFSKAEQQQLALSRGPVPDRKPRRLRSRSSRRGSVGVDRNPENKSGHRANGRALFS